MQATRRRSARLGLVSALAVGACLLGRSLMASEIVVTSNPPGAEVWVDGRSIGQSPARLPFATPGNHRVRVALPGWIPFEQSVSVTNVGAATVHARLVPAAASRKRSLSVELGLGMRPGMRISDSWHEGPASPIVGWGSTGAMDNQYRGTSVGFGPTLAIYLQISQQLALELSGESFDRSLTSDVSISEKREWWRQPQRTRELHSASSTYTGSAGPFAHRQMMLHLGLAWRQRVGRSAHLELSGGPSLFRIEQDTSSTLWLDWRKPCSVETQKASMSEHTTLSGCAFGGSTARALKTRLGFHAGAALAVRATSALSIVAGLRVSTSFTAEFAGVDMSESARMLPHSPYESFDPSEPFSVVRVNTTVIAPRIGLRCSF